MTSTMKQMLGGQGKGPKILNCRSAVNNDQLKLNNADIVDKSRDESGDVDHDEAKYKKKSNLLTTWLSMGKENLFRLRIKKKN